MQGEWTEIEKKGRSGGDGRVKEKERRTVCMVLFSRCYKHSLSPMATWMTVKDSVTGQPHDVGGLGSKGILGKELPT